MQGHQILSYSYKMIFALLHNQGITKISYLRYVTCLSKKIKFFTLIIFKAIPLKIIKRRAIV